MHYVTRYCINYSATEEGDRAESIKLSGNGSSANDICELLPALQPTCLICKVGIGLETAAVLAHSKMRNSSVVATCSALLP